MINLHLYYGYDGVPSDLPDNIDKHFYHLRIFDVKIFNIKWHSAQIKAVTRNTDAVILSWDVQYLSLWLALLKGFMLKKPLILWGHGYSKKDSPLKRKIRNFPAYLVKAIILYDFHTADELKKIKGLKNKIFIAPNSLDYCKIQEAKNYWLNNYTTLKQFQVQNRIYETYNIIYIGRIYKENHLEILLKAIKEVSLEIKNIKLIIIGKVNDYVNELKSFAFEMGISDKIKWTDAIYDEYSIAPWMLSSNVFCYPENVGLSLIHAFGYGLPAITNNLYFKHGPEIWALKDGINGLTFRKNDFKDLARQIIRLYKDEDLRKKLSNHALETVKENYNLAKMVDGFLKAINYAIKK
ncbi:Glycosyltransferase [Ignavibacterium album JCM 16511]|uniref:Glycosyltransferase n=2 Tax=Ignavibacterium album TaxID=591197 RepID=I0AJG8_IGNAJ|nr:Glycosyltransferase [Ignavibacterium album JCM 16511]